MLRCSRVAIACSSSKRRRRSTAGPVRSAASASTAASSGPNAPGKSEPAKSTPTTSPSARSGTTRSAAHRLAQRVAAGRLARDVVDGGRGAVGQCGAAGSAGRRRLGRRPQRRAHAALDAVHRRRLVVAREHDRGGVGGHDLADAQQELARDRVDRPGGQRGVGQALHRAQPAGRALGLLARRLLAHERLALGLGPPPLAEVLHLRDDRVRLPGACASEKLARHGIASPPRRRRGAAPGRRARARPASSAARSAARAPASSGSASEPSVRPARSRGSRPSSAPRARLACSTRSPASRRAMPIGAQSNAARRTASLCASARVAACRRRKTATLARRTSGS